MRWELMESVAMHMKGLLVASLLLKYNLEWSDLRDWLRGTELSLSEQSWGV